MGAGEGPTSEERLQAVTIGPVARLAGPVELSEPDPAWRRLYAREARRIRRLLGDDVLGLEHVGSTSVPGLAAKPIVDILLVVADSADERAYAPRLEAGGYVLRIREPDWEEHRLFKGPDTAVNVHVFSPDSAEVERMIAFRDRLRSHPDELGRYLAAKRELAARDWEFVQDYADAKTAVVESILARDRSERGTR